MARKQKERISTADTGGSFHQPFAGLAGLKASLPEADVPEAEGRAPAESGTLGEAPARAVIRRSRKGRGGREVTEISHLGLPTTELAVWLRALRTQLGCGGALEEDVLVLHGDQRERTEAWLRARGVRKITLG